MNEQLFSDGALSAKTDCGTLNSRFAYEATTMNAVLTEPTRHRLSVDDYHRMAQAGILAPDARVELINGEIIDMAPLGTTHRGVVDYLNRAMVIAVGDRAIVRVQGAITLDGFSEPEPDLVLLKPRKDFYSSGKHHPSGKDTFLVVEVAVSSERFDRQIKVPLYAQHGVPAVMLLVPESGHYEYFTDLVDSSYQRQEALEDLSAVALGSLEDCHVDLSWLTERLG